MSGGVFSSKDWDGADARVDRKTELNGTTFGAEYNTA